jgi:tetratricopeptide (TPR) repeat protein
VVAPVAEPDAQRVANPRAQLAAFENAMRLFHARKLREARAAFELAKAGPERDIANRAGLHMQMCDRRLQETEAAPSSAEDCYNYGIAMLNTRNAAAARDSLSRALAMAPDSDHIHYALAISLAMLGDLQGAYTHLYRAIELEPRNRLTARQDADFAPFIHQSPLDTIFFPEKRGW